MSSWVTDHLGASVSSSSVELGLRRNPRRPHLLVSRLLGKHIPVAVCEVHAAGRALGALVAPGSLVVGFAETATALGHAVAAACGGGYLHTTRRCPPAGLATVGFAEEHSHAVDHAVGGALLETDLPIVLVDDEISTGRSARNAIAALQQRWPRSSYTVASLLDAGDSGWVSLEAAEVVLPPTFPAAVATLAASIPPPIPPVSAAADADPVAGVERLDVEPLCAAFGWSAADDVVARQLAAEVAARLDVARDGRTLVLGDEEHLWFPQLVAAALGPEVRTSSTTRSPALAIDEPGYPLRTAIAFPSTADPRRVSYAYNVVPSEHPDPGNAPGFDHIVLVTDERGPHASLVGQIASAARVSAHVVGPC